MGRPIPEHRHRGGDGSAVLAAAVVLAVVLVIVWVIHVLLMLATVIGGAVMIGGAGYGYLRYHRWRAELDRSQAAPGQLGHQAPVINLHIHGDVPPDLVSQVQTAIDQAQYPGTVPAIGAPEQPARHRSGHWRAGQ
jgi:Flp pilus assembly protein TadB